MAGYPSLPTEFTWRDDGQRHTLSLDEVPLAQVEPVGSGWVVRALVHQIELEGDPPSRISVPSLDHGKAWITRWAQCRQQALTRTVAQRVAPQASPLH